MKILSIVVLLLLSTVMLGQQGTMIGAAVPPLCFKTAGVPAGTNLVRLRQLISKRHLYWGIEKKLHPINEAMSYAVWVSPNKDYGLFIEEGGKGWTLGYGASPDDAACDVVGWLNIHTEMYWKPVHMPPEILGTNWLPVVHPEHTPAAKKTPVMKTCGDCVGMGENKVVNTSSYIITHDPCLIDTVCFMFNGGEQPVVEIRFDPAPGIVKINGSDKWLGKWIEDYCRVEDSHMTTTPPPPGCKSEWIPTRIRCDRGEKIQ